jgi:hypothetical protein
MAGEVERFRVGRLPRVESVLKELIEQAGREGNKTSVFESLRFIHECLETAPLTWGDPTYHTKHPGGVVYHRIHKPYYIHYAAYELERVVLILDLKKLDEWEE